MYESCHHGPSIRTRSLYDNCSYFWCAQMNVSFCVRAATQHFVLQPIQESPRQLYRCLNYIRTRFVWGWSCMSYRYTCRFPFRNCGYRSYRQDLLSARKQDANTNVRPTFVQKTGKTWSIAPSIARMESGWDVGGKGQGAGKLQALSVIFAVSCRSYAALLWFKQYTNVLHT